MWRETTLTGSPPTSTTPASVKLLDECISSVGSRPLLVHCVDMYGLTWRTSNGMLITISYSSPHRESFRKALQLRSPWISYAKFLELLSGPTWSPGLLWLRLSLQPQKASMLTAHITPKAHLRWKAVSSV